MVLFVFSQLGCKTIFSRYIAPVWHCLVIFSQPSACLLVFSWCLYRSKVLQSGSAPFSPSLWDAMEGLTALLAGKTHLHTDLLLHLCKVNWPHMWIYFWTRCFVLLIYVSAPSQVPGFLCYCSSGVWKLVCFLQLRSSLCNYFNSSTFFAFSSTFQNQLTYSLKVSLVEFCFVFGITFNLYQFLDVFN